MKLTKKEALIQTHKIWIQLARNPNVTMTETITVEEIKRIAGIVNTTYSYLGGDIFLNDCGEMDYSKTFTREEITEICLDADHWRVAVDEDEQEEVHDIIKRYYGLSEKGQSEILAKSGMTKLYGY